MKGMCRYGNCEEEGDLIKMSISAWKVKAGFCSRKHAIMWLQESKQIRYLPPNEKNKSKKGVINIEK